MPDFSPRGEGENPGNQGVSRPSQAIFHPLSWEKSRKKKDLPAGKKVLIVLDQFEQWLHAKPDYEKTDLVQALRECDGERVQCVLLVRDDFWTPLSRFLKAMEIRQEEGRNLALVDRFDLRHAKRVLVAFGQDDGMLDASGRLSKQQAAFVQQSIAGLAQEGKIICVRLVLFAQMIKGKPWTPATLKSIGGVEKVGVTFLKETFSDRNAPERYHRHEKAAEATLKALLPEQGTDIKGAMKSKHVLLQASGYARGPNDFDELLDILNSELRLITPTPPPGSEAEEETQAASPEREQYYQLTETVASLPGPIRRSLGRNRENRLGTRSMPPSWPPTRRTA